MKKKWHEQIEKIWKGNEAQCPNCGKTSIQATFHTIRGRGFIVAWCNNCRHGIHISRAINPGPLPLNIEFPNDLIYD